MVGGRSLYLTALNCYDPCRNSNGIQTTGWQVMVGASSPLRLSIWRNFTPKRPILTQGTQSDGPQVLDPDNLQEEIYTWQTAETPFDGIADETVRQELRSKLLERLNASLLPSERGIGVLNEFIQNAENAIASGRAEWTISQSESDNDEETADQVNGLLALTLHLKWLSDCFADRPGISVSVR